MKICIINNLYPPYTRGGAEQVVVKTVEGLILAGHEVVVITTAPPPTQSLPYEGSLSAGQAEVVEGSKHLAIYRYTPYNLFFYTDAHQHSVIGRALWHVIDLFHISSMKYVEKILAQEKPDVVHTHNLMGMSFLIPRMIRRLGIRHVHTVHDVQLVEPSGVIRKAKERSWRYHGAHAKLYSFVMKELMGSPQVVISPSQFLLNFYESRDFFSNSKRVVLRNPVTLDISPLPKKPHDGVHFLYLGQIEEHKGIIFLVKTFLEFFSGNLKATLHIAGSGSGLGTIKQLTRSNAQFVIHGKIDREKLPQIFADADVTIVPSLCYENSPTVIFESFSFGVPVLASNVEGIAELIRERENGLTFATEHRDALLEKLGWCVSHPDELHRMGEKAKNSLSGLSVAEYVSEMVSLYSASSSV